MCFRQFNFTTRTIVGILPVGIVSPKSHALQMTHYWDAVGLVLQKVILFKLLITSVSLKKTQINLHQLESARGKEQ